jgi:hypothetical protein
VVQVAGCWLLVLLMFGGFSVLLTHWLSFFFLIFELEKLALLCLCHFLSFAWLSGCLTLLVRQQARY